MKGDDAPVDLQSILDRGMGTDLHWFPEEVDRSRLAETLAGMANTSGGHILLGIAPRSARILGITQIDDTIDRVFQAALLIDPPLILPIPEVVPFDDARLLRIAVPSGLPHVYRLDGRYLGREGRYNAPIPARRLRQLLQERGMFQFESHIPPDVTMDALDDQEVAAYLEALNLPAAGSPEEILLRRGCLREAEGKLKPTYAALLLFGRHPQQWLPNATILAARFPGKEISDEFVKQDITATLPNQLRLAEQFVRDNLRSVVRLAGMTHEETFEYPLEAVRELLVNAIAHRDYNIQGDNIHLHIFADHLEVHSPGGLPGPVNLENLLNARFSRNPVIVQVLSDLGFVERLGYGLNRVVAVTRANGLRPPHFEEVAGIFRVVLYNQPLHLTADPDLTEFEALDLNPRQMLALNYLASHHRITNRAFQELCPDVHPETLRRDLVDMVSRDLLLKIGEKRATYYILKSLPRT